MSIASHRSATEHGTPDRPAPAVHLARCPPVRRGRLGTARRPHRQLADRRGRLRAARRRVPGVVVAERHEHRLPEVLPRDAGHVAARVVASSGRRPDRRHDHPLGDRGRLLRRRGRSRRLQRGAEVHPDHAAGGVQQPGVVQHRRRRCAATGVGVLHPLGRRRDELDPQLVPRGGDHLQGRFGCRGQPVTDPLVEGADDRWRHGVRPGELHARRRCVGRHDQVGRQDAAGGEDGHPRRRPSRHRRVHLVQGDRGTQGPCAARRRLRHGPRRCRLVLRAVPERQQLGQGHRRVHAGRRRRRRLAPHGGHHRRGARNRARPRPVAADGRGGMGVCRPRPAVRHHDQPLAHRARTRSDHWQ